MKKIAILLPVWGRADVFKIVSDNLEQLTKHIKYIDFTVFIVYSKNDPELPQLMKIVEEAGYKTIKREASNNFLGKKLNIGVQTALKEDWDYMMNFGSDDLAHTIMLELYLPYIRDKVDVFGLNNVYFYDIHTRKSMKFSYYNNPHVVGAGRMISRKAVEEVMDEFGYMYDPKLNRALDGDSGKKLLECGYKQMSIDAGDFPMLVDVKCGFNINSFERIKNSTKKSHIIEVSPIIAETAFPCLTKFNNFTKKMKK